VKNNEDKADKKAKKDEGEDKATNAKATDDAD